MQTSLYHPLVNQLYGEGGQQFIERIAETLACHSLFLSFHPEGKYFSVFGADDKGQVWLASLLAHVTDPIWRAEICEQKEGDDRVIEILQKTLLLERPPSWWLG